MKSSITENKETKKKHKIIINLIWIYWYFIDLKIKAIWIINWQNISNQEINKQLNFEKKKRRRPEFKFWIEIFS